VTGYSDERAAAHGAFVDELVAKLEARGLGPRKLPVDGHEPDIALNDGRFVDAKTTQDRNARTGNYSIEKLALERYLQLEQENGDGSVLVVHADWTVDTPTVIAARLEAGDWRKGRPPQGSNDVWKCYPKKGAVPFARAFPLPPTARRVAPVDDYKQQWIDEHFGGDRDAYIDELLASTERMFKIADELHRTRA
jgi:hypothetical protein